MIVGPGNAGRPGVVDGLPAGVQFLVLTVEMVGVADAAEGTERDSQILMIARGQNAPTSLMEPGDRDAIVCTEAATNVDAEQPKLVEIGIVDLRQNRIVAVAPAPVFAGFERLHDWMGGGLEVLGRVAIRRAVAASDMATRQGQTQV